MKTPTIVTLEEFTEQEIFDFIAKHLLTQNAKSIREGKCLYLDRETGRSCAVGCLIPSTFYKEAFEDRAVFLFDELKIEGFNMRPWLSFLTDLQCIHDGNEVDDWLYALKFFASSRRLNFLIDSYIPNEVE